MPTHIKEATAVGMENSSTSPMVKRGASGNSRLPSPNTSRGMITWSISSVTRTGRGGRMRLASSRKPPPRLLSKVMKANSTMTTLFSGEKTSGKRTPRHTLHRTNQGKCFSTK